MHLTSRNKKGFVFKLQCCFIFLGWLGWLCVFKYSRLYAYDCFPYKLSFCCV